MEKLPEQEAPRKEWPLAFNADEDEIKATPLDKIKELNPYYYISKWEYYEDRADRLAVIADALAVELQYIAEAKLLELEAKLLNLIKIVEIVNWDHDGGMVEITEQEYRLIKDAIRVAKEE